MDSYNTNRTFITHLLGFIIMFIFVANSDDSQDVQECSNSLVGLSTCLPYVGGTAKSPTPDCCSGLKQVLKTSKKCLCVVIKDRNDPNLGLNINVTLALTLPDVCKAPANISQCPALLKLPPSSPDAQVFYQLNSTSTSAPGPAGGPAAHVNPIPVTSPSGANATGSRTQQSNDSSAIGNTWFVPQILGGVLFLWANFIQV